MEVTNLVEIELSVKDYEYLLFFDGYIVGKKNTTQASSLLEDIKPQLPKLKSAKTTLIRFSANSRASPALMDEAIDMIVGALSEDIELVVANRIEEAIKDGDIEYVIVGNGVK
ncbi:MAG: hypothetical protein ACLFQJ_09430 [Campylobacterales bacterium]